MKRLDITWRNRALRLVWGCVYVALFRLSPTPLHFWRRLILRIFGAKIGPGAHIYPSCKIWAPWNLVMGENSCLAPNVNCYNVGEIRLGKNAVVSQNTHLCGATHDKNTISFDLYAGDIFVGANAWIAADAFISPDIVIGDDSIVYARSVVTKNIDAKTIVAGNPAAFIRNR